MMRYFDANVRLGRFNAWSGHEPVAPADLIHTMNHYGIHEALVVDSLSYEYHAVDGNERVLAVTGAHPRLHPAWAALPPGSREMPSGDELVADMQAHGVRAAFLYPRQYHFTLDDWCVDDLLGPLAERRVPVFICPNTHSGGGGPEGDWRGQDKTDWPGVVRMCRAFPQLPVVVVENRISYTLRTMYQALEACPNLRVELSTLWLHHAIEFVCREWGAKRLVFGSGLPVRDPGAVLGQLNYSDISDEDLALVAGQNLRRLLSWDAGNPLPAPVVEFPKPVDELHDIAVNRRPLEGQGFECAHGHLGRTTFLHIPDGSIEDLLAEMDRLGIERGIVFANGGLASDEVYANNLIAEAVRACPDRFIGFVSANLHRSPQEIRSELERGFAMGLRGIKIHPELSGYDTNEPNVEVACAVANERRSIIVNHYWGGVDRMVYLCRKYPDACFITGHTHPEAIPATRVVDNLYIGTCPLNIYGTIDKFVAGAGADRILFGSDLSWNPVGWGMGPILYANIPVEAKRLILGGNIRRLLHKYGGLAYTVD